MKKYLWSPAPLLAALLLSLVLAHQGSERGMDEESISQFTPIPLIAGLAMSAVWLLGCALHDLHQWNINRPIRRMLKEDEERKA